MMPRGRGYVTAARVPMGPQARRGEGGGEMGEVGGRGRGRGAVWFEDHQ